MAWITRLSILNGVKQGDSVAWNRFYEMYRPLVWLCGADRGLTESEQADLLSNVMLAVWKAQKTFHYEPSKGKFRYYFRMTVRNEIFAILRKRQREQGKVELDSIAEPMDEQGSPEEEQNWQAVLFREAWRRVQFEMDAGQVQAFDLCKMQNERPADVAKKLGLSQATVYNYCKAVLVRLQELVKELDAE